MPEVAGAALRVAPSRRELVPLIALLGAAGWAFQLSYPNTFVWLLLLPAPMALVWRAPRMPRPLVLTLERLSWAVLSLVVAFAVAWTLYPVFPAELVARLPLALGQALALLGSVFVIGSNSSSPPRALLPCALGLLLVGHLPPGPEPPWPAAVLGALATVGWLLLVSPTLGSKGAATPPLARIAVFVAAAGLIAFGLVRLLPWAQPHVERTAAEMLFSQPEPNSGLSLESRLGEVEELKLSRRTVLRVWSTGAQKLRARVLARFDGRSWHPLPARFLELPPAEGGSHGWLEEVRGRLFGTPEGPVPAGPVLATKIVTVLPQMGLLPAPAGVFLVKAEAGPLRVDEAGLLQPPPWPPIEAYGMVNRLGALPAVGSPDPFLQVPEPVDERMRSLAARLATEAPSPAERVTRTLAWVESECRYSLRVGRFRSRDPVAEFLFEKKQGYCEYFASAAALLLRLQGVPTRYVTGFHVDAANRHAGHYVVREADAHAWIEAYIDGRGWMEADPTPAAEYEAVQAAMRGSALERALDWVKAAWAALMLRLRERDWRAGLALLLPLAAAFGVPRVWRRLRPALARPKRGRRARVRADARTGVPPELAALLARLDRAWARSGFPRPPHRTPLEHLEHLPADRVPRRLVESGRRVVECFYRARYGAIRPTEMDVAELRESLLG